MSNDLMCIVSGHNGTVIEVEPYIVDPDGVSFVRIRSDDALDQFEVGDEWRGDEESAAAHMAEIWRAACGDVQENGNYVFRVDAEGEVCGTIVCAVTGQTVRVLLATGQEAVCWDVAEYACEPENVMGAIVGAARHLVEKEEPTI